LRDSRRFHRAEQCRRLFADSRRRGKSVVIAHRLLWTRHGGRCIATVAAISNPGGKQRQQGHCHSHPEPGTSARGLCRWRNSRRPGNHTFGPFTGSIINGNTSSQSAIVPITAAQTLTVPASPSTGQPYQYSLRITESPSGRKITPWTGALVLNPDPFGN
ncbi:MAG: hypothetical protein KGO96_12890, partial [Elusimicrobia bacterium]|nr:hypothetical protein [Elusimicrobiota bacterium]